LVTAHPLQAFSRRYFQGDERLFSYSQALARAASVAGRGTREAQPFMAGELPPPERESRIVDLGSLVRFFRNPAKHLFERRLKVRLETADEEIEAREPFELKGLTLFDLKQRLLDLRLRGVEHDGLTLARAGGDLPHGRMGEVLFADSNRVVDRIARKVGGLLPGDVLDSVPFAWKSGEVTLTGALDNLSANGMLDYRMTRANVNLRIRAWIRHLALNAFAPPGAGRTSRCVTEQGVITFAPVEDARARLAELLKLYWSGLHRPLHFFPRTACKYVEVGEITGAVRNVWEGGYDLDGERDDPYYALAFRGVDPLDDAFEAAARTIFEPMTAAVSEEPLE
jgi:exodeoxyribonuclease V gamma subunit